jgi:hypothetical protein
MEIMNMSKSKAEKKKAETSPLCGLVKKGYHTDHPKKYKLLLKDSNYMCGKCGRAAADKKNLCKPAAI